MVRGKYNLFEVFSGNPRAGRSYTTSILFFLLILNLVCLCWTIPTRAQWTNIGLDGSNIYSLAIDPSNAQTIYAGTDGGGVYKSTNGGGSWVNSGLTGYDIYSLAIDPLNPQTIYAGTWLYGVWTSTNGGGIWTPVNSGLTGTYVYSLAIDPLNPQTIYAGTNGDVFKSTNGGEEWVNSGPIVVAPYRFNCLAIDPLNPQTIYAGTNGGAVYSWNGGGGWVWLTGLGPLYIYSLAIDPLNPQTIYAGTWANGSLYGVFESTNGGANWVNSGLPENNILSLAIDPLNPQTIYAGAYGGVFKSTNGGTSWVNSGLTETYIYSLVINPSNPQTIYAGTNGGVYVLYTSTAPGAPTIGTATPGNAEVTVSFTPPTLTGGSPITGYTATSSPGGKSASGPAIATSITVTGLTNGTAYTFTVTASNAIGTSQPSAQSNQVTPGILPGTPTKVTAKAGNGQATVNFKLPTNGTGPITSCTATSKPDGIIGTGVGSPITVQNLTNGTAYTFTVTATNATGTGPASSPSNSVTPLGPPGVSTNVTATASNGQATVSFIPPTSTGGSPITDYTATSIPGGKKAKSLKGPIIVKGLTNGTPYTFTVTATNKVGTSLASAPSNPPVIPATLPGAPTGIKATAGNDQVTVSFKAPSATGGSAITYYTVSWNPAGGVDDNAGSASLSHTVTGLNNGTKYTFRVTATNEVGTGPASVHVMATPK